MPGFVHLIKWVDIFFVSYYLINSTNYTIINFNLILNGPHYVNYKYRVHYLLCNIYVAYVHYHII
jgi:hypothetical protein